MSPRPRDGTVRADLLRAAARIVGEEGPGALTTRRLASEIGVSTRSVYTYFGGMDELRHEVRRSGFAELDAELDSGPGADGGVDDATGPVRDAVTDLALVVGAFFRFGVADPHRYRAMFVDRPPPGDRSGGPTFERLLTRIASGVAAGRFPAVDPGRIEVCAAQVWSMTHGMVTMVVSGLLDREHAETVLVDMLERLAVGYGDQRDRAARSIHRGFTAVAVSAEGR